MLTRRLHQLRKAMRLAGTPRYRRGLVQGIAAAIEHAAVLRRLRPSFIVDVGANAGQFSLLARETCPTAPIVAFEPLTGAAARYRRLFAGDAQTRLEQVAIGAAPGQATLHVSRRDDSSSLLPIGPLQTATFAGTDEAGTEAVAVAPLSAYLSPADIPAGALLKIDVQGYELPVIEGCGALLGSFGHVYVELSFIELYEGQALAGAVMERLIGAGFRLMGLGNATFARDGSIIQADFLFGRQGTAP